MNVFTSNVSEAGHADQPIH